MSLNQSLMIFSICENYSIYNVRQRHTNRKKWFHKISSTLSKNMTGFVINCLIQHLFNFSQMKKINTGDLQY